MFDDFAACARFLVESRMTARAARDHGPLQRGLLMGRCSPSTPASLLFRAMHAYSPYHNVEDRAACPAVLLTGGEFDPGLTPATPRR